MPLHRARNRVTGSLAPTVTALRSAGGTSITVSDATLLAGVFPFLVTPVRAGSALAILEITGASGNTLVTSGPVGGMADVALQVGDRLEMRMDAEHVNELQDAVAALQATGGDKTYIHTQLSPSTTWTVAHHLDKYPAVFAVDSGDTWVIGDVTYLDVNTLRIVFNAAFGGRAFLN